MKQPLLSRPSLRILVVAGLLLFGILALPATSAFAATPAQASPTTDPVIYQSEVMPSASSAGRVVTLTLEADGSAAMSTDYMNGEDPIVEVGSYVWDGDQLSVTLTGRADRDYDAPVELVFTEQTDGSLVATEYDTELYGSEGLTLNPAVPTGQTGAGSADAATAVTAESLVGTYSSGEMPSADTAGLVMTLTLNEDGSAAVSTDYMNGEPPYDEAGDWSVSTDGTVALNITGQADGTDGEVQNITMDVLPDGSLKTTSPDFYDGKGITFSPVLGSPAGVYVSQIVPAASSPGMVVFMILYENGDVQASTYYLNNEPPVQESGVWTESVDSSVIVTVTASADTTYDQPQQLVFQRDGDTLSFLSLTLTRLEVTPAQAGPTPVAWYQTDVMPAASSPGIQKSLILYDDNSVTMITDYQNGEAPIVEIGDYIDNDDDTITVTLTGRPDREYDSPDIITFAQDGDTLTATEYDESIYGTAGLTFTEQSLDALPDESAEADAPVDTGAPLTATVELTDTAAPTESTAPASAAPESSAPEASSFEVPSGAVGVYATAVMPAASSPGMQMRLVLFADNSAQMITDYMNGEDPIIELGKWTDAADGNLNVSLLGRIANVYATPVEFVFERTDTGLITVEWDEAIYGSTPLVFQTEYEA